MRTVKLTSAGNAFEANVIKGALENEGINCILHNELTNQVMTGYANVMVDIFVAEADYERAREVVEKGQPAEKAKPISKAETIVGIILLVLALVAGILLAIL